MISEATRSTDYPNFAVGHRTGPLEKGRLVDRLHGDTEKGLQPSRVIAAGIETGRMRADHADARSGQLPADCPGLGRGLDFGHGGRVVGRAIDKTV